MSQDTKEFHNPSENSKFNNRCCIVTWRQIRDVPRVIILCNYYLIKDIKIMWPERNLTQSCGILFWILTGNLAEKAC